MNDVSAIMIERVPEDRLKPPPKDADLGFGRQFTDHMLIIEHTNGRGWHDGRIVPYAPLQFDPACACLHYAQQIFEGLKAYRGVDGGIRLFRARQNLQRMQRSAKRMCLPILDIDAVHEAMKQLVLIDKRWIPHTEGCALYIRPNMIATDPYLGVRPSERCMLYVILCPVGAYYAEGFNPVSVLVQDRYVRAIEGGVGEAKTGGNYAASLLGQVQARDAGFTQCLWLDGKEHRFIEEVGTMNIFFLIGDEVVTSPLSGTILPGITRDAAITVLKHWGDYRVTERALSVDELVDACRSGQLKEAFGTGTAAVISPVGSFSYQGQKHLVGDGQTGKLAKRLYDYLTGMQYGREDDIFGWTERID